MKKRFIIMPILLMGLVIANLFLADQDNRTMAFQNEGNAKPNVMLPIVINGSNLTPSSSEATLSIVQNRGYVKCATGSSLPGLSFLNPTNSKFEGLHIDFCKALAAAIFGDATAFEIVPVTGSSRFIILQTGEADVLLGPSWTLSRDTSLGFDFQPTTFYDGQGMMVPKNSGITTLQDFDGGKICVQAGTTTEKNLANTMSDLGINYQAAVYPDSDSTREAYDDGLCDGFTSDKSALLYHNTLLSQPENHTILAVMMSKEPSGPLTRHGDNKWGDIVMWTVNCTIQAEELGVDSTNVDSMLGSDDPNIASLLGVEGDLGVGLGLGNSWCYHAIKQIGNYGEIYNRHVGSESSFSMARSFNELWTNGGLIFSPPLR
ncbi:MAG: amino acid ABC transporter substrate-binding protein [Chloroflexi bacterium]|nr:MAG: amino acid ABC transporter substrate-binding protein [Chloroflexota bacterium]